MSEQIKVIHEPTSHKPYLIIDKPAGLPSAPLTENDKENAFSKAAELFPQILNTTRFPFKKLAERYFSFISAGVLH